MSYMAIPTMAQAMANKVGTTAHARPSEKDGTTASLFETLLTAAGKTGSPKVSAETDASGIGGIWSKLLTQYMTAGRSGSGGTSLSPEELFGFSAGIGPESFGAMMRARLGDPGGATDLLAKAAGNRQVLDRPAPAAGGDEGALGALSAAFESGASGTDAIGYDPGGGTSYGIYQIASRPGTMARFIDFLDAEAPAWGERLRSAGPANTGGTGGRMPRAWREIASEDPTRFAGLQHAFIEATHYRPAEARLLDSEGLQMDRRSEAIREVLWSTAVQHGPDGAARIFQRAAETIRAGGGEISDAAMIERIYGLRAETADRHAPDLASALRNRFRAEKRQSLQLLAKDDSGDTAMG